MNAACGPYMNECSASPTTTPTTSIAVEPLPIAGKNTNGQIAAPAAAIPYTARRFTRSDTAPASGIRPSWQADPTRIAVSTWPRVMPTAVVA
jgi:hypothetical protein